jgi:adenosylcobinamide hydrolase
VIEGIGVRVDATAVVVAAARPLTAVSSAVVGGGVGPARAIVNLHVPKGFLCDDTGRVLDDFVRRRGIAFPFVGLLTAAWTEKAEVATEKADGLAACAVVTVGLGDTIGAGRSDALAWRPSTINTIVVVDAAPEPAALVNLVMTATEVKVLTLAAAGVRAGGGLASGTPTDAVVIAATGRGRPCRFGGPASEIGALAARAVRSAMEAGVSRWLEERR